MSTYGTYSVSLRQERLEELRRRREEQRKEKVRQEATKLIAESRQTNKQFLNHMTQHFGQSSQQQAESLAQRAEPLLQSNPDQALKLARKSRATMERGMAEASRKTDEWNQEKAGAEEAVAVLRLALESTLNSNAADNDDSSSQLTSVAHQLAAAKAALRGENFEAAKELAVTGQEQIRKIEQARRKKQEQEEVRREIVRGLRHVLTDMGFNAGRAKLGDNNEKNKVILVGNLPSGRTARFVISLDGQVEYDFDGYPHRQCGKDSEKIRSQLEEQCRGETTVVETHWKGEQPKRISEIARPIPTQRKNLA